MPNSDSHLKRQYGLLTAVAVIIGQVIAVGIFLTPAGMARSVGSPFWLLVIWLVMGTMTLCGALCYAELAARFPEAGGSYVYLREAYGSSVAFLYGWMVLLVLDPGLTAIFSVGLTSYLGHIVAVPEAGRPAIAIAIVVLVAGINIFGARLSSNILKILTALKVGFLLFIVGFGFIGGRGDLGNLEPFFAVPPSIFGAFAGGMVGAFFSFAGWWELTRLAGEIRDPEQNLPRALTLGVIALTIIYIATSAVFLYLVPLSGITSDETFAAQAGEALFGSAGGKIFAAIVVISVLGTLVAYLMVSPRVYFAMAKDGVFFDSVARVHPRFGTPSRAVAIQALLASALILSGSFQQILSVFFFVVVFFIAMTVAGLFLIRRKEFAGYKTPFFPITPIVFLVITAIVLFFIGMQDPIRTLVGVAIVLIGIPVYYFVFQKGGKMNGVDQDYSAERSGR
jgi:basic amino acid/polyamine antiporter, APA family